MGKLCDPDVASRSLIDWLSCVAPGPVNEKLLFDCTGPATVDTQLIIIIINVAILNLL